MAARAAVADRGYSLTSRDDDHARLLFRYIIYKGVRLIASKVVSRVAVGLDRKSFLICFLVAR